MLNIYNTAKGYMVQEVGAGSFVALFGTDTLPSGFTAHADGPHVLREIQRLNAGIVCVLTNGPMNG